ncbi:hypothetical protein AvCA_04180 [Azotobacter vinelandii CA]|uniref:Uncharacterized protein n=2 Tax=Azotobacter vinelandii TaxID=354 RepID=C1DJ91_AZOVD|nr:hypothetical protein Avin_04180 [Azotobacter vinelandii DJ]AGK17308.1 hypothetical protein AvCA_04180 [Azotobacter vinelandii CA]AGK19285.1 hypothetical protein AvCA6_04180 [Azotobacter vinelandii CA6]
MTKDIESLFWLQLGEWFPLIMNQHSPCRSLQSKAIFLANFIWVFFGGERLDANLHGYVFIQTTIRIGFICNSDDHSLSLIIESYLY